MKFGNWIFALGLGLATVGAATERAAAQHTAEALLARAAEFYAGGEADPVALQCTRELLAEITEHHPDSDIAVEIVLAHPVAGLDIVEIEARAGTIGAVTLPPLDPEGNLSGLSETELARLFAWEYRTAFVDLCKELAPALIQDVAAALIQTVADFGLRETAATVWEYGIDALTGIARSQDLAQSGAESIANIVFERLTVEVLDGYAAATNSEVDSERIVSLASPTAQLIVAAATASGPAAPALLAGTTAFFEARGGAMSSYAEDAQFAIVARNLISADAYRRAADEIRVAGRPDHAAEIEALADAVIEAAAEAADEVFAGSDGPVAAAMLRDMDEVIRLYRVGEQGQAQERLRAIHITADENAPGLFSPTFNNFYERYFMIGPQHRADSVRAYFALHDVLQEVFVLAPVEAALADAPSQWGPGLVAGVDVGFYPCREPANETDACLRALGFSDEAISFSFQNDEDYSGYSVGIEFRELGEIDLAIRQFIGNTFYYTPILLNGDLRFQEVAFTDNLQQAFQDGTSQQMLRHYARATNIGGITIRSHRLLPDGTQRFTVMETVNDGCRVCEILGSAVSFLDIGSSTSNRLVRRPIGLLLSEPGESAEMTTVILRNRPESLQFSLNALGYDAGEMDGFPGPQTRRALMEFQVENCLPPTGQPDLATGNALLRADGFEAPCAGAQMPDSTSANTPLLSGIYVDDLALCNASVPYETAHLQQRIVRSNSTTWGVHGGCETQRTDIRDGVTLFRGTCSDENVTSESRWRFDILSSESFIDLDMPTAIPRDAAPRSFSKCPDDSALRTAYGRWFGDAPRVPEATAGPVPGLPFPDGTYVTDARLCPPAPSSVFMELGDMAEGLIVDVTNGNWHWGHSSCTVRQARGTGTGSALTLDLDCLAEGLPEQDQVSLDAAHSEGFSYFGRDYWQCQAPMTELPLPAGVYAHDDRLCPGSIEQAPNDVVFEAGARPLFIDESTFSWDHVGCEITSARQAGPDWGLDLSCAGDNDTFETTQTLSRLSDTTVVFDGFEREWCGPLVQPVSQGIGDNGEPPVDLEERVYALEMGAGRAHEARGIVELSIAPMVRGAFESLRVETYWPNETPGLTILTADGAISPDLAIPTARLADVDVNGLTRGVTDLTRETALTLLREQVSGGIFVVYPGRVTFRAPENQLGIIRDALSVAIFSPDPTIRRDQTEVFADLPENIMAELSPEFMERLHFVSTLGFGFIGLWESGFTSSSAETRRIMSLGVPNANTDLAAQLGRDGILLQEIAVGEVTSIFTNGPTAEAEFRFAPTSGSDASIGVADSLGLRIRSVMRAPQNGRSRDADMSSEQLNGVWVATFRQYDDGWRLYSVQ